MVENHNDTHKAPLGSYMQIQTEVEAQNFVDFVKQKSISHIGVYLETECDPTDKAIGQRVLYSSYLAVSFSYKERGANQHHHSALIHLHELESLIPIQDLLDVRVCYVGYDIKQMLIFFWNHGLKEPSRIWDIAICDRALGLGTYSLQCNFSDQNTEIRARKKVKDEEKMAYSLSSICDRHDLLPQILLEENGSAITVTGQKNHDLAEFMARRIVEKSRLISQLYFRQVQKAIQLDILHHLITIEMPWIATNAKVEAKGVKIDFRKFNETLKLCEHSPKESEKSEKIVNTVLSLACHCQNNTTMRIFPRHIQLGAVSGRQTCSSPNITSIGRRLRPLVIPEDGYGIGEVDLCQAEVGLAAAIFDDQNLLCFCNAGDVYARIARVIFADELPAEVKNLSDTEFKKKYATQRKKVKITLLSFIYGSTAYGIASRLEIPESEARLLQESLRFLFPTLTQGIRASGYNTLKKGYATCCTGLRRNRSKFEAERSKEYKSLINFVVQGSAAALFKKSGNRLCKLYPKYKAHIIIPLHDSFVFEAPLEVLHDVANLTARVMCETIREFFPALDQRAEINITTPSCWNKDETQTSVLKNIEKLLGSPNQA